MESKIKLQLIIFIVLFILTSNSLTFALTNNSLLKISEIDNINLACLYYPNETRLAKVTSNNNYVNVNFDKKINLIKNKRDLNREKYLNETARSSKSIYNTRYKKFKKILNQIKKCKNYNTAEIACEIFASDSSSYKIINGAKCLQPSASIVGKILIETLDGNEGICTGTLIGPNVFLSAAHCFDSAYWIRKVTIVFGGKNYKVVKWVTNPSYGVNNESGDTSLIYIENNLKVNPLKLVSKNYKPKKNELAAIIGYGIVSFNPYHTGFYGGFSAISKVTDSGVNAIYKKKFGYANTCNGDSGGPLSVFERGSWRLYGTTSYGDDDQCGYFTGAENSWWSKITSNENVEFLEANIPGIFD